MWGREGDEAEEAIGGLGALPWRVARGLAGDACPEVCREWCIYDRTLTPLCSSSAPLLRQAFTTNRMA